MNLAVRPARSAAGADQSDAQAPLAEAAAPAKVVKARRPDKRAAKTTEIIVSAAHAVMLERGASKVSAREVCEQAGISRGTLYRYFPTMEALHEAVALDLRTATDQELLHAMEGRQDPNDRFLAFLDYTAANSEMRRATQFLHVEPAFVLKYYETNFVHFIARVNGALGPVFDHWEKDLGQAIDRDAISEMMVRYALSETLVPTPAGQPTLPMRLRAMFDALMSKQRRR